MLHLPWAVDWLPDQLRVSEGGGDELTNDTDSDTGFIGGESGHETGTLDG